MKLHYSQTILILDITPKKFYYLMKLHYSQTSLSSSYGILAVLLPYEITLFSNTGLMLNMNLKVLLPYEITLFSN